MPTWKQIVGTAFNSEGFESYCRSLKWTTWQPSFITLHNTAVPNLKQRPKGLTAQHIQNLVGFYRDQQHWSAGPHLFIDDLQIWVFTPLTSPGVHSPSWNNLSIGIEMLGDYATESFTSGRGLAVRKNAVSAIASLCKVLQMDPTLLRLHKEDPKTTHICPGKNVIKSEIITEIQLKMNNEKPLSLSNTKFKIEMTDKPKRTPNDINNNKKADAEKH